MGFDPVEPIDQPWGSLPTANKQPEKKEEHKPLPPEQALLLRIFLVTLLVAMVGITAGIAFLAWSWALSVFAG